jgi:hypothetical protein
MLSPVGVDGDITAAEEIAKMDTAIATLNAFIFAD